VNKAEATARTFRLRDQGRGMVGYANGTATITDPEPEPARTRTRSRSVQAPPESTVELRGRPSGFRVELGPRVRGQIADEIRRVHLDVQAQVDAETWRLGPRPNTNVEVGGWLLDNGPPRGHDRMKIVRATHGGNSTHGPHQLAMENPLRSRSFDPDDVRRIVGDWHCHLSGDTIPSGADLEGWHRELERHDRHTYVGAIVTPDSRRPGWRIHPWVVRHKLSTVVCEPAQLVG